ncbi:cytochrome c [Oricola thermophila]|uniref:C-type cytochrome n=1 Tax=Oricola thermophila TaxID=2742145 RepID=A0A6N1VH51_9HYPH|nr:c-type cytochrome [Oricola thermophila]QKV19005.1 c-type cytochrome [Oricola thermophila]
MLKRTLQALVGAGVVAFGGYLVFAYEPEIAPIDPADIPAYDAALVEKGRVLAAAGYCASCHTAADGAPYAGNYPMETGFGTLYSTNITPDPEDGIGAWSEEAFLRAMHDGVNREGQHLFPAFPFDHFTKMSDEDARAIYAYLMTEVAPATTEQEENGIPFPLGLRIWQAGWKLLFVDSGRFEPDPDKSDDWNRGAYLVEGVSHCGACHTPRNPLGAEIANRQFEGAAIDRWIAPALTARNESAIGWTAEDFAIYLKDGATRHQGVAAGPMAPVVHAGLRELPDSDLNAIGIYLADVTGNAPGEGETARIVATSLAAGAPTPAYRLEDGERLYAAACASCHYNAEDIALGHPDLGINSALRVEAPDNLVHVILNGVANEEGIPGVVMPAFRNALDDDEIAAIAAYLRASRTDLEPWPELVRTVSQIRIAEPVVH